MNSLYKGINILTGKWEYGDLVHDSEGGSLIQTNGEEQSRGIKFRCVKVHPQSVGAYTGVDDMHGREIFEGDYVSLEGSDAGYLVIWNEPESCFIYKATVCGDKYAPEYRRLDMERDRHCAKVIGNTWDGVWENV